MFLTDITDCHKYYICVNQTAISQVCENKLFFDADSQSCKATSSSCLTCNANSLSFHALARTCNKFIICFGGVQVLQQCYDKLQFNPILGQCDLAQNVDCVENHCNIFNNPAKIAYIPSAADCKKYYICMNGKPFQQTCAKSLQYNPACNCCQPSSDFKCSIKPTARTIAARTIAGPPSAADISCPKTGFALYPHNNPASYYMCAGGKGVLLSCADGLLYDGQAKACREPKYVPS